MKFQIVWKPVLVPLYLREYQPEYGDECLQVCVNPATQFLTEKVALGEEYALRYAETAKLMTADDKKLAEKKVADFLEWNNTEFMDRADGWFATLWSFGADQWTPADLKLIKETDPHLLTWLKNRSMEMIEAHKQDRKKK
jgi:hypothetical protein